MQGEFVLEYKYDLCYDLKEKAGWKNEYVMNDEGSYVLEVQLPNGNGWICLDATRNYNSFGRYINHASRNLVNIRMHAPLMVRKKWRVGFYATRKIEIGEELAYDYGQ